MIVCIWFGINNTLIYTSCLSDWKISFCLFLQAKVNSTMILANQHDNILKKCEGELWSEPWKALSTYSNCCLVSSVLLGWSFLLTLHHVRVLLPFLESWLLPPADLPFKAPHAFPLYITPFSFYPSILSSFHQPLQTMCLTGVPITVPIVHHCSISQ